MTRRLLWVSLADQRQRRELFWLSLMPGTKVTAMGEQRPSRAHGGDCRGPLDPSEILSSGMRLHASAALRGRSGRAMPRRVFLR